MLKLFKEHGMGKEQRGKYCQIYYMHLWKNYMENHLYLTISQ
jgi:hypothetical protein